MWCAKKRVHRAIVSEWPLKFHQSLLQIVLLSCSLREAPKCSRASYIWFCSAVFPSWYLWDQGEGGRERCSSLMRGTLAGICIMFPGLIRAMQKCFREDLMGLILHRHVSHLPLLYSANESHVNKLVWNQFLVWSFIITNQYTWTQPNPIPYVHIILQICIFMKVFYFSVNSR